MPVHDVIIIGGGISGLSALHFLRKNKPHLSVQLFEADTRLGGTIGTDMINGYSFDWGPNGFLDREPLTLRLVDELGMTSQLERANESVNNRFILRGGKLQPVPMSPPRFLMSGIISWPGKLRIAMEPFAKGRENGNDESVYDFVKRRIGKEAADYLVQPMVSGVYGGVAQRLSLQSCFPIMREMEDQYGSLFKALIAKSKEAKAKGKRGGGPSGPGGWLTSFRGGLNRIIEAFEKQYGRYVTKGLPAVSISRDVDLFKINFVNGTSETCRHLILATPSYIASDLTESLSSELSESLGKIPYAPIGVVCSGYRASWVKRPVDGFGFLVPAKENRGILGSIWTSSIFANRAPQGMIQFRTMIGGDGNHESIKLSDDELINTAHKDLAQIMNIEEKAAFTKTYRWKFGIPQYRIGHREVLNSIETELSRIGNLHLASNAYYGIGLNDCVKQAYRVVEKIA